MRFLIYLAAIFVIIFLGILIFGHHSKKSPVTTVTAKTLPDLASTDVKTQFTTDGQINGDDVHRQIIITVGRDQRTLTVIQGYQGNVLKSESFANNQSAYSAFLHALDTAGFTLIHKTAVTDMQGQCPLGQRFTYQTLNGDDGNINTWSTSCNNNRTFGGQAGLTQTLFQNQITNYSDFTGDVSL